MNGIPPSTTKHSRRRAMEVLSEYRAPSDLADSEQSEAVDSEQQDESEHGTSFTQKAGNLRRGKVKHLPGLCPGGTPIVAPNR